MYVNLKGIAVGFSDGMDVECEGKEEGIKDDFPTISCLSV